MKEVTVKISKPACLYLLCTGTKGGHYHPWPRFPNLTELKEVLLWGLPVQVIQTLVISILMKIELGK